MTALDDSGQDRGGLSTALMIYMTTLSALSLFIVGLRLYVRTFIIRKIGLDDWTAALACLGHVGVSAGIIATTKLVGLGRHTDTLSSSEMSQLVTAILILSLGYHFVLLTLKAAFLLQYRRSFPLPNFQLLCDIFLAFLACWTVAGAVASGASCPPGAAAAGITRGSVDTHCEAGYKVWLAHGIINIITDVAIYVMPLPLIRTLPLSVGHKVGLIVVFSLGFFTCIISGLRLTTVREAIESPDPSYNMAKTVFWSMAESTSAIVCLCIPTLRPLLSSFLGQSSGRQTRLGSGSE